MGQEEGVKRTRPGQFHMADAEDPLACARLCQVLSLGHSQPPSSTTCLNSNC